MAALSEGMALAEKCDLDQVTLLEVNLDSFEALFIYVCLDLITRRTVFATGNWKRVGYFGIKFSSKLSFKAPAGSDRYFF